MGEGRAAVVLQRTEQRIGVDLVASRHQGVVAVIAAKIVPQGVDPVARVSCDVSSRSTSIKDGIVDLYRCATTRNEDAATAVLRPGSRVAAQCACGNFRRISVEPRGALGEDSTPIGGRVAT